MTGQFFLSKNIVMTGHFYLFLRKEYHCDDWLRSHFSSKISNITVTTPIFSWIKTSLWQLAIFFLIFTSHNDRKKKSYQNHCETNYTKATVATTTNPNWRHCDHTRTFLYKRNWFPLEFQKKRTIRQCNITKVKVHNKIKWQQQKSLNK